MNEQANDLISVGTHHLCDFSGSLGNKGADEVGGASVVSVGKKSITNTIQVPANKNSSCYSIKSWDI